MMRIRTAAAFAALLLAAGCGEPATGEGEGTVFRYSYQPGGSLDYEVSVFMDLEMEASGNAAAAAAMNANMAIQVTESLDLSFASGSAPGTIEVTMTQEVTGGGARMTAMGQEQWIPFEDLAPELDTEVVVIVDSRGRVVSASVGGMALPTQFLTDLSALGGSSMLQPQQFGPEFPEEALSVGEEWRTGGSTSIIGLNITQTGVHRVAAQEEMAGRQVYRIESRVTTGEFRADLADMMEALRETPELLGGADPAQLDAALAQFEAMGVSVSFVMRESTAEMTTWFDPLAGIVARAEMETPAIMTMVMRGIPGGDVDVVMEMTTRQQLALVE